MFCFKNKSDMDVGGEISVRARLTVEVPDVWKNQFKVYYRASTVKFIKKN